ncbi:MAG: hypothetical protein NTX43_10525 [Bacteroidetes bacterium]|nr:hypothetical protein [Bacteroidota bacterium]
MKPGKLRNPEYILLAAVFILLLVLSFLSQGYYGGADNINHYFLSRYSFLYPKFFLDPWGRPLYTILSSPFAQFGFQGIKVFNVILGTLSAWLLMKTARELKVNPSWIGIIILCFTPLYMIMLFTAMTEILFSFVFICSLYLFFSKRYIAAAIVISFLPFARSEGYFMIPVIFLGLFLKRQWKAIPFLGLGFVFFSLIGAYQFRDLLWVIRKNPYPLVHSLYHTPGDFWSFIRQADITFGIPVLVLICLGIIMLVVELWSNKREKRDNAAWILLMFVLPVLVYYFFHSFMFSRGWAGSLGLIRVIAAVIPLTSMIALYGFSLFSIIAGNRKWLRSILTVLAAGIIIVFNFITYKIPIPLGDEEKQVKKAADWVTSSFKPLPLVVYNDFNVPYFLNNDPYSPKISRQIWFTPALRDIPVGAVYIWDSHFGPNECRIPLDTVMQNPYLQLIRLIRPAREFLTFGNYPYELYIFRKNPVPNEFDNYFLTRKFIDEEERRFTPVVRKVFDFEKASPDAGAHLVNYPGASGKQAYLMDGKTEFSPGLIFPCRDLPFPDGIVRVKASVNVFSSAPFTTNAAALVISLEDKKGSYSYQGVFLNKGNFVKDQWNQVFLNADLPKIKSRDDVIKVYVWHTGKTDLVIDDLIIDILAKAKESK